MGKGNGMTRGDRRRNARREQLRGMLPRDGAVIGIDLADEKQALAVIDHDVRVLARKMVRVKAFRLGEALDWAVAQARAKGFTPVTVACEPTGPRWLQVQRMCAERGLRLVCVQPLVSHIARQQQDYTTHKTDEADCVMIAVGIQVHVRGRGSAGMDGSGVLPVVCKQGVRGSSPLSFADQKRNSNSRAESAAAKYRNGGGSAACPASSGQRAESAVSRPAPAAQAEGQQMAGYFRHSGVRTPPDAS